MAERPQKPRSPGKKSGKKAPARRTKAAAPATAALVRAPGQAVARTEHEWRFWADALVDQANLGIRKSDLEKEAVADLLFRELCRNDTSRGLEPGANPTQGYLRLLERAGKSLRLTSAELSRYLRIGALNQLRRDAVWRNLDWTFKRELLALLALDDGRRTFNDGVQFAAGPNVGEEHVIAWVQERTPRLPGSAGRPRGATMTLAKGGRFAETGVLLGDEAQRERFVGLLLQAPEERQQELVDELERTHGNLGKLLASVKKKRRK